MVKIVRNYINNTTSAWVNSFRATLKGASHIVSSVIGSGINTLSSPVGCRNNSAQVMQTMTSIIMPSGGGR